MTLDEMEAFERAATPGPWGYKGMSGFVINETGKTIAIVGAYESNFSEKRGNGELICASRGFVPKACIVMRAVEELINCDDPNAWPSFMAQLEAVYQDVWK